MREGIVRMMEERREKQQLQKVLSELREAHRELMEEVEMLRGENNRLKEKEEAMRTKLERAKKVYLDLIVTGRIKFV